MKPTAQVRQNVNERTIDTRYQQLRDCYHPSTTPGNVGDLEMLIYVNELYTAQWQERFIQVLKDQKKLSDIEWDQFYQSHVDALYYYQNVNQTNDAVLAMIAMKLKALEIAYNDVVKRRYIALLSSQPHLTDEGLQKFCNKLLAENHPDRYQSASHETINRQTIRFQVLNDILKELKDPNSKDSEQAKVNDLKDWFLSHAQGTAAATTPNASFQFAARFVQEKGLSSHSDHLVRRLAAKNVSFNDSQVVASTPHALTPTVTPAQLALRKHEQTLQNTVALLEAGSYLTKQDFEDDKVHPLIWSVILNNKELIQRRPGGVHSVFRLFIKHQIKEKIPQKPIPTYPWIITAYLWTKEHCRCPIDDLAERKPQYKLNDEERLFLSLTSWSLSRNFHMEYYKNPSEAATDQNEDAANNEIPFSLETDLNTTMLDDLALRDLAWELIVDELKHYRAGTSYYKNLTAFISQIDFIYEGVRRGALSLNLLHRDLIAPIKQLIKDLQAQLPVVSSEHQEENKEKLLPSQSNQIIANRIEQLHIVLEDTKVMIHQEIRKLVAMPRIDPDTKELLEQKRNHKKFISQLYKKVAGKIEEHASSKKIGKHRNIIGPLLKGAFGVVAGIALTSTGIGALAWTSKIFRISFRQTFFDTLTQSRLRECEKRIIRDNDMIQRVSDIGPVLREDDYFSSPAP